MIDRLQSIKTHLAISVLLLVSVLSCRQEKVNNTGTYRPDTLVVIQNNVSRLTVSLWGGAITGFRMTDAEVNPFTWRIDPADLPGNNRGGAPLQGHFICFGRWGSPTVGELQEGIPYNGEPANGWWEMVDKNGSSLNMHFSSLLDNMMIHRHMVISGKHAVVVVSEEYHNPNSFGRTFTIVQHPTIGPPFLSEKSGISTNATWGFLQSLAAYGLTEYEYRWPYALADTARHTLDLRGSAMERDFVATHIIEDTWGWVTVTDPRHQLLLGYIWKADEYPWLHIWHGLRDGELWAKGLEFGTTGIGDTFPPEERFSMDFHGRKNFEFYDAKETKKKSYILFMLKVHPDYTNTKSVEIVDGELKIMPGSGTDPYILDLEGMNPWDL